MHPAGHTTGGAMIVLDPTPDQRLNGALARIPAAMAALSLAKIEAAEAVESIGRGIAPAWEWRADWKDASDYGAVAMARRGAFDVALSVDRDGWRARQVTRSSSSRWTPHAWTPEAAFRALAAALTEEAGPAPRGATALENVLLATMLTDSLPAEAP